MIHYENKDVYENLKKLEKSNYRNGVIVLVILAAVTIFGLYNAEKIYDQEINAGIVHVTENKSIFASKIESIIKTKEDWIKILIAVDIPLLIIMIYFFFKAKKYAKEVNLYCPYCYKKGFTTTTLYEKNSALNKKKKHIKLQMG